MKRLTSSIRIQLILVTIVSLIVLAVTLEALHLYRQQTVLFNSERRVGLTLITSVNTTINAVSSFISTLDDIVELDVRLAELTQLNTNIDFIAVTDAAGLVIFHSNNQYQGQTIAEFTGLPADTTVAKQVPGYGQVVLTALAFDSGGMTDTQHYWIIVASASEPINDQLTSEALSSIVIAAVFTVIASLVMIVLLQSYFVRPIEQLTQAAQTIEGGNLTAQITTSRNDEIGQLARAFNQMTRQLAGLINTLEERVRQRTQELEVARDQAEQASRAKSDFLSNMSHELRTPLNMVIGYTSSMLNMPQMYRNTPLPDVFHADIELIRDSGKHLLALINDILDLSKVEAGKLELNFTAVDLNMIFDGVVAASLGLIGDRPLQVRQKYPDDLPFVWADNVRVRQILLNLLSNGIKYTETGSVTLSAEVRGSQVYIAVTDTGPGIPTSALSSIFDRFEQLKTNTEIQGTGLGLDISQRLAQLHGSQITIETQLGQGSTFAFTLPVASPDQLKQEEPASSRADNVELFGGDQHLQKTIVVLAKDAAVRQPLRRALEAQQMVVIEATDHLHAFDLATGLLPDVIILDGASSTASDQKHLLARLQGDAEARAIPVIVIDTAGTLPYAQMNGKVTVQHTAAPEQIITLVQQIVEKQQTAEER